MEVYDIDRRLDHQQEILGFENIPEKQKLQLELIELKTQVNNLKSLIDSERKLTGELRNKYFGAHNNSNRLEIECEDLKKQLIFAQNEIKDVKEEKLVLQIQIDNLKASRTYSTDHMNYNQLQNKYADLEEKLRQERLHQ